MAQRKVALITGASRGLGYSMAKHLVQDGVDVIGTYRSNEVEARAAERDLSSGSGAKVQMLQLDVGDVSSFTAFVDKLASLLRTAFGQDRLDFVVQNGGGMVSAEFATTTAQQLDELYTVHFKGPYLLTQALLPLIRDGGRIVNITTAATRFYLLEHGPYSAMKAATETMTLYMAQELGARRIRVNSIAPGAIATDFGGGAVRDNAELNDVFAEKTALGRVGEPADIGGAVAALLSDKMGWVNGQRIEVNGGQDL